MEDSRQLEVSDTVPAPPEQVFALLADPARHTELDGAGMLRGLVSGPSSITAVGDTFVMDMNQDGLGDYRMSNEVVDFELNRRIAWAPSPHPPGALKEIIGDMDPSGHTYSWELEPTAEGGTRVTHVYDWSGVRDERALDLFPRVSEEQMAGTISRIAEATDSVRRNPTAAAETGVTG
jgi:uncharacterized protein YndB with AHSA1/START domain